MLLVCRSDGFALSGKLRSVKIINIIAEKNNYSVLLLSKTPSTTENKFIYEILITQIVLKKAPS